MHQGASEPCFLMVCCQRGHSPAHLSASKLCACMDCKAFAEDLCSSLIGGAASFPTSNADFSGTETVKDTCEGMSCS